jgi:type VI secretion system protein ImpG
MSTLFTYYERELLLFYQLAKDFRTAHPAAASRLQLEDTGSVDPHVERLIQAFALLAGRIHHKLDDEFPELTEALLNVLYPHYLAPIPAMAIIQFDVDPSRVQAENGFAIHRHQTLKTQPVHGIPCQFRTAYPVTLWPIEVTRAQLALPPFAAVPKPPAGTVAALRLDLECHVESFAALNLDKLRFYLSGDQLMMAKLYELIFSHTSKVGFRFSDKGTDAAPLMLDAAQCLTQVGFEEEEGLLSYPNRSFHGYRLLTEFFAFPSRFFFFDLGGWQEVRRRGVGRKIEVVFFLDRTFERLEDAVDASTFRLGCTPVINLFEKTAEPMALTSTRYEYQVLPDASQSRGIEVYSVDAVRHIDPATGTMTDYQPFYSFRHGQSREGQRMFWYTSRRPAYEAGDRGTEVFLNLVNLDFKPQLPYEPTLVVWTTCTNRDLPIELKRLGERLEFELEAAAPARIHCLRPPSSPLRPPLRRAAHWRLISHLSLNHLSLTDAEEGRQAFQEILRLYDFSDPTTEPHLAGVVRQLVEGITALRCRPVVRQVGGETASGFARGIEVVLELDETKYIGTGAFLFACVIERFLALYVTLNSFTQLRARTKQGEGYFKTWRPRAGEMQLL